jgi:thioredoxin-like negative regulator of GroEL
MKALAPKHFDTRFLKISVGNAPFLVTKLNVRVLPCVIAFLDGISVDRITGFEGLGTGDKFATKDLERRLVQSGVLVREKMSESDGINNHQRAIQSNEERNENVDEDEWY